MPTCRTLGLCSAKETDKSKWVQPRILGKPEISSNSTIKIVQLKIKLMLCVVIFIQSTPKFELEENDIDMDSNASPGSILEPK